MVTPLTEIKKGNRFERQDDEFNVGHFRIPMGLPGKET